MNAKRKKATKSRSKKRTSTLGPAVLYDNGAYFQLKLDALKNGPFSDDHEQFDELVSAVNKRYAIEMRPYM